MTQYISEFKQAIEKNDPSTKLKLYDESIKDDLKLRKLFVTDRGNDILTNDVGLFSVFDNYEIFKVLPLSDDEKSQSVIMTKDMEVLEIGSNAICTKEEFMDNYEIFTEGILECMNWNNLFMAGGSITALLTKIPDDIKTAEQKRNYYNKEYYKSDIDLYVYGLNETQANKKMFEIYENIKKVLSCDCTCIRSGKVVTIVSEYPYRHVQIVLRLFDSFAEILHSFDVDSCSVGFDGTDVWSTRRAHYAITNRRNIIDMTRRSITYEYRLKKYNERGYGVVIPEFDKSKINYRIFSKSPSQVSGLARLLILENINDNVKQNLYGDVLNMHQGTMYKNLSLKSTYEKSDYSLVYLPWGKKWNAKNITEYMNKKNALLNSTETDKSLNFMIDDLDDMDDSEEEKPRKCNSKSKSKSKRKLDSDESDSDEELMPTERKTKSYTSDNPYIKKSFCFIGTIYKIIKDNGITKPVFLDPIEEKKYTDNYVYGKLKWYETFNNNFAVLGSFNPITDGIDEWYSEAYGSIGTDILCDYICNCDIENIKNLIEITKQKCIESNDALNILLNSRDVSNRNPLHTAVSIGNLDICKILLDNGSNPMATSKLHKNVLHSACMKGNLEIIKLLLKIGSKQDDFDINKEDSYGLLPIMYTLIYGHTTCFKYLYKKTIKKDTDLIWIFKLDKSKSYRALEMCLLYKRYDIATFLLDMGYDIHDYYLQDKKILKNKQKNHVIEQAISNKNIKFINLLIEKNGYDTYEKYLKHEGEIILEITKIKSPTNLKYTIDFLCYLCELNKSIDLLADLLFYFADNQTSTKSNKSSNLSKSITMPNIDMLKYLIETKKININLIGKKKTILDIILCNLNEIQYRKIKLDIDNKLSILTTDLQNKLYADGTYIVSNDNITHDKNNCLSEELSDPKNSEKISIALDELIMFRDYLLSLGAKTYNDLNNISTTDSPSRSTQGVELDIRLPIKILQFVDLDGNTMYKTNSYTKLFNAIITNDLETIYNLTINTNDIHLCVNDSENMSPLLLAFEHNISCVPELLKIINMQNIKKKTKETKKKTHNKTRINNTTTSKKTTKYVDETVLYEEKELDESNKYEITHLGVDDIFSSRGFISSCLTNYDALSLLLNLDNEIINDLVHVNFSTYMGSLKINKNNLECMGLLIHQYATLLNNNKRKYNLSQNFVNRLILVHNSVELLHYFHSDVCRKMWNCKDIAYPFDKIFTGETILHTFGSSSMKLVKDNTKLLRELKLFNKDCDRLLFENKLPIQVADTQEKILMLIDVYYTPSGLENGSIKAKLFDDICLSNFNDLSLMHKIIMHYPNVLNKLAEISINDVNRLVNIQTIDKRQTPLMLLIKNLNVEVARKMIEIFNPDQTVVDVFGNTALHYAMQYNLYSIVKILTAHSKENYFRMTPQDYIINKMRSSFHHIRNNKLNKQYTSVELHYIIAIYNDFIVGKEIPREFTHTDNIKKVNDYIMDVLKNTSESNIPELLKL